MTALIRASIARRPYKDELEAPPKSSLFPTRAFASSGPCFSRFRASASALSSSSSPSPVGAWNTLTSSSSVAAPEILSRTPGRGCRNSQPPSEFLETEIEKSIYGFRFMTLLGVLGSLLGSFLCFIKGCTCVANSFMDYALNRGKVVFLLVEAIDVYLLGTVMLVFGMGLYELFVSNLDIAKSLSAERGGEKSNLFGMFTLKERPQWLEIKSVNELKTKLGHVIVMLLLIGLFDKSKKAAINTPVDLLCFSASVLLSSGCLYLLSKLNGSK
ncbi:hypothetical protein SAY86_028327 [Trapa natans]|uniref:Uncharacterized protein n=1 Tax=Trapa natans TaxID=22666 RepID=A0AAN7LZ42_TRANT|nr:hypothetical protein SAY86_028327 [Trapa natans]